MVKWITDRLPEKNGDYLVTTKNGYVQIAKFWKGINENQWSGRFKKCVIAWTFLPEAYKGESDE